LRGVPVRLSGRSTLLVVLINGGNRRIHCSPRHSEGPIYDDDEEIAVEILRLINNENMTGKYVFQRFPSAEWFAQVYHDVELDKDRWHFRPGDSAVPEPVDRIVVGAPLWVRCS
jgi:hypothetical protein